MATNKKAQPKVETVKETKVEVKTEKKVKVTFKCNVISDYGNFVKGETAEISETAEKKFKAGGMI